MLNENYDLALVCLILEHTCACRHLTKIKNIVFRENDPSWANEIQDDVIEECNKHGGIVHIYVDKNSTQVSLLKTLPTYPK